MVDFYRFSIAWSRVLPTGDVDVINQPGINYYNKLINELLANNIKPVVTIYHWDLPQRLQDLGGWANPIMVEFFEEYARILFETFGDRVKTWITVNEPLEFTKGYGECMGQAPDITRNNLGSYLAAHTVLMAHARVYHLYDDKYRPTQGGKIGITLNSCWEEPQSSSQADIDAADRAMQFALGWFAHPIFSKDGGYPPLMKERLGELSKAEGRTRSRLPVFSKYWVDYIKGTSDFFGLNHYTSNLCSLGTCSGLFPRFQDIGVKFQKDPSWPHTASFWFKVVPWGFRKLLNWIHKEYNGPAILVTENGYSDHGELEDVDRCNFYQSYLAELAKAINIDGVNVIGYTAWSLIDNLEWSSGYREKFGLFHVDFSDPARPRRAKTSVKVLANIISSKEVPIEFFRD